MTGIVFSLRIGNSDENRVAVFVPMRRTDFAAPDPVENNDANDTLFDDGIGATREVGLGKPKPVAVAGGDVHDDSVLAGWRTPCHCFNVDEGSARRLSGLTESLQSPVSVHFTPRPKDRHPCRDG